MSGAVVLAGVLILVSLLSVRVLAGSNQTLQAHIEALIGPKRVNCGHLETHQRA